MDMQNKDNLNEISDHLRGIAASLNALSESPSVPPSSALGLFSDLLYQYAEGIETAAK